MFTMIRDLKFAFRQLLVLTVAALIATWLPARHATRVNPVQAFRAE
jgi:ABC-type lipoprotein release transport system permease subunit